MMLLLLHGPAISTSRKKLIEIKQKFDPNNVVIFEKGADFADILATLQTVSMFEHSSLVIVENPIEDLVDKLSIANSPLPTTLVFWFDHELKKIPNKKTGVKILFFPEAREISVFPFLDKLGQRDKTAYIEMDKLKRAGYDSQYFITMIFYLLRTLTVTPKSSPEFVKKKIAKQHENFSSDELVTLYKYVIETDFKIKSGLIEPVQAEFLLVNRFMQ